MPNKIIKSSYLSFPLNSKEYKEVTNSITKDEISEAIKDSIEGILKIGADEDGKFLLKKIVKK